MANRLLIEALGAPVGRRAAPPLSPLTSALLQSALVLILAFQIFLCVKFFWSTDGLHTLSGIPLYGDFKVFWIEARHALAGEIQYDQLALHKEIAAFFSLRWALLSFLYPPDYALLIAPFGLLPFQAAGLVWGCLGLAAYTAGLRSLFAGLPWLPLIAFTGVSQSLLTGQNSLFTTGLFAAIFALAQRAPVLAGIAAAMLATKPQLAVLIPILLLASGLWKALAASIVAKLFLIAASIDAYGLSAWSSFLSLRNEAMAINAGHYRQSVYNIVSNLHGAEWQGYFLQTFAAFWALLILAMTVRRLQPVAEIAALGAAATPLISPVFLDYDLTILAIPAAYLAQRTSRARIDMVLIAAVFLLPMTARWITIFTHATIAPLIAALLLARIAHLARRDRVARNN